MEQARTGTSTGWRLHGRDSGLWRQLRREPGGRLPTCSRTLTIRRSAARGVPDRSAQRTPTGLIEGLPYPPRIARQNVRGEGGCPYITTPAR